MITPSSLDRIDACPPSDVLPQVRESNSDATRGTIIHGFLEAAAKHGREEALALIDEEHRLLCAAIDLDRLPLGGNFRAEVAFAYDYARGTARELPVRNREYVGLTPTEIPGTADVVANLDDETVYVGDYKTGHLPPPPDSLQLRTYALMAARALGASNAVCEIIQVREDGTVWRQRAEMDAFELAICEQQIRDAVAKRDRAAAEYLKGRSLTVTTGDHCRYCPAFRSCPATLALAKQVAAQDLSIPPLTKETAALALERVKTVKKLLATVEDEIKAFSLREKIPLSNGKTYGPRPWSTREVVVEKALPVLEARFGREAVDRMFPRKATVTAIENVAKEHAVAAKQKVAPFTREVMAELEAAGAITTEITEQIREH